MQRHYYYYYLFGGHLYNAKLADELRLGIGLVVSLRALLCKQRFAPWLGLEPIPGQATGQLMDRLGQLSLEVVVFAFGSSLGSGIQPENQ